MADKCLTGLQLIERPKDHPSVLTQKSCSPKNTATPRQTAAVHLQRRGARQPPPPKDAKEHLPRADPTQHGTPHGDGPAPGNAGRRQAPCVQHAAPSPHAEPVHSRTRRGEVCNGAIDSDFPDLSRDASSCDALDFLTRPRCDELNQLTHAAYAPI